jgi:hypothetical protein
VDKSVYLFNQGRAYVVDYTVMQGFEKNGSGFMQSHLIQLSIGF